MGGGTPARIPHGALEGFEEEICAKTHRPCLKPSIPCVLAMGERTLGSLSIREKLWVALRWKPNPPVGTAWSWVRCRGTSAAPAFYLENPAARGDGGTAEPAAPGSAPGPAAEAAPRNVSAGSQTRAGPGRARPGQGARGL